MAWSKWLSSGRRKARRGSRRLAIECVETRRALAGDLDAFVAMSCVDAPPASDPAAELVVAMSAPATAELATDEDPMGGGDPTGGANPAPGADPGAPGDPMTGGGGVPGDPLNEEAPNLIRPQIVAMDYEWTGTSLTVFGYVYDDGPIDGLFVEFDGLLSGVSTLTDDDGYFSVTVEVQQNFGQVGAVATDVLGLESDPFYITVL